MRQEHPKLCADDIRAFYLFMRELKDDRIKCCALDAYDDIRSTFRKEKVLSMVEAAIVNHRAMVTLKFDKEKTGQILYKLKLELKSLLPGFKITISHRHATLSIYFLKENLL